jgi:hypothetical protein
MNFCFSELLASVGDKGKRGETGGKGGRVEK